MTSDQPPLRTFALWRRIHLTMAGILCLLATVHSVLTVRFYEVWSAGAVWFLGTGLGLLLVGLLNWSHVGLEPCRQPTAGFVRWANWGFAVFAIAAVIAVPAPQAFVIAGTLLVQALAAHKTLPGPT